MVKLGLQIKCSLFNVTDFQPADKENFGWCLTLKCPQCGEKHKKDVFVSKSESHDVPGGRGTANFVMSCSLCKKHSSIEIVDISPSYSSSDSEKLKTVMIADYRGIEPVTFKPEGEWTCSGEDSGSKFEIKDGAEIITDGWYDYDDEGGCEVSITEFSHNFIKIK